MVTLALKTKLQVSNPTMPKVYCLPNIHKSCYTVMVAKGVPAYNLAKWKKYENLPIPLPSCSLESSLQKKMLNSKMAKFYDIMSLFCSVPIHKLSNIFNLLNINIVSDIYTKNILPR